jgi:hypothetical protein
MAPDDSTPLHADRTQLDHSHARVRRGRAASSLASPIAACLYLSQAFLLLGCEVNIAWDKSPLASTNRLSGTPMLGHATGDDSLDLIVETFTYEQSRHINRLAALDAHTGKPVWTSEPLEESKQSRELAVVGKVALIARGSSLSGYDLGTGRRLWRRALPERLEQFCDDGAGAAGLLTSDGLIYSLDLATADLSVRGKNNTSRAPTYSRAGLAKGQHSPWATRDLEEWEGLRAAAPTCWPASSPEHPVAGLTKYPFSQLPKLDGMRLDELWREREGDLLLAIGRRASGSGVPMIAVLKAQDESLLWKTELPSKEPLDAKEGAPSAFALGHGQAVAAYFHESEQRMVISAWLLGSGQRQWEASIPAKIFDHFKIALTEKHVFVHDRSSLHAFSLSDGAALWHIEEAIPRG